MRIVIGSDHAGFELKASVIAEIAALGHEPVDTGVFSPEPSDYPDIAEALCTRLIADDAERGVLICGSGVGVSVAANKFPGIRAAICHDTYSAHQGVEHDDMNVLVIGARVVGTELARELVRTYLSARFSNEERHRRRLNKVLSIEREHVR
jgi:ribose 5-phosphate isomerase B